MSNNTAEVIVNERESIRRTSSNRFEVEKVEETTNPSLKPPSINEVFSNVVFSTDLTTEQDTNNAKTSSSTNNNRPSSASKSTSGGHPSALKKTVKHYIYDDTDEWDLDSHQNTATKSDKTRFYPTNKEHEPLTKKNNNNKKHNQDSTDEDEDENSENMQANTCFQVNYDSKNEPVAITCNLNTDNVQSYRTCVHDFKTIALYQKLTAEFIGTCLLTLYACSIGMPISEQSVPSLNGCLGGGLTLATLVWCLGNVSGGHFNPAVTIAFLFTGKINPLLTMLYVGSQLVGALTGASVLKVNNLLFTF
jgi:hypothetical protein